VRRSGQVLVRKRARNTIAWTHWEAASRMALAASTRIFYLSNNTGAIVLTSEMVS
jgi:hypothetical protein